MFRLTAHLIVVSPPPSRPQQSWSFPPRMWRRLTSSCRCRRCTSHIPASPPRMERVEGWAGETVLPDRVEEDQTAVILPGGLAPDQQTCLGQAVAGQPAECPVSHDLEELEGSNQDPVLQPSLVVLRLLAQDGLDRHVAGVEAAHQGDEDLATVPSNQADQHQACQT